MGALLVTREDLEHFVTIVDDLAGADKTIEEAKARLRDEGLTEEEANSVIQAWMRLYGKELRG